MHLVALRNNRIWSTAKGPWAVAGSVCGLLPQRGDSSTWFRFRGETWCVFMVENGIALAREHFDNLMIDFVVGVPAHRVSNVVVSRGVCWCVALCDDGGGWLVSFDGEKTTNQWLPSLTWPSTQPAPVLEAVGDVFFLCPTAVYLKASASERCRHGVISKSGVIVVPPTPAIPAAPAHSVFCQTPRFSISTKGTLAIVDGDTLDLRTLLEPIDVVAPRASSASDSGTGTMLFLGDAIDTLLPAVIGGRVIHGGPGGVRQADIIGYRYTDEGLWVRLSRPLWVTEGERLQVYGGFDADPVPYQYKTGPLAGTWAPRGIVSKVAWTDVAGVLTIAVARPGEVVVVQVTNRALLATRRLDACTPAQLQVAFDGTAVHVLCDLDRWERESRLFPAAGAAVGSTLP